MDTGRLATHVGEGGGAADGAASAPLLVIVDSADPNRFASYLLEILDAEGLFGRDVHDLAARELTAAILAGYRIVVVAHVGLPEAVQEELRRYVAGGGYLIALRPPTAMDDIFLVEANLSFVNQRATDRYLALDDAQPLVAGFPCRYLQFIGTADLYRPAGAEVLAWVAGDLDKPTGFAAVTVASYGAGHAAMFAYDLATCVVRQHQGRPENASTGTNADADDDGRWSPNDLFIGQLDPRLKDIPQADVHQELLVRILTMFGQDVAPIPRAWYFPNAAPAIAWFNGDSDGMDRSDYDLIVSAMERHGGVFTAYLLDEHHALFTEDDLADLRSRGHAFGQHTDLDLRTGLDEARANLAAAFAGYRPAFGGASLTHRGHCLVWPGWTDMADILASNGVRIDQSFVPRRFLKDGYLNGSGRPARFMRENGTLVDLYEQNTLLTDDGSVEPDKFLVPTGSREEVIAAALGMLNDASSHYHGVFQVAFHPHLTVTSAMWLLEALVRRCDELDVAMVNGDQWARFHDARRRVRFTNYRADVGSGAMTFRLSAGSAIHGLTIMVPRRFGHGTISGLRIGDTDRQFAPEDVTGPGLAWATTDLDAGEEMDVHAVYRPVPENRNQAGGREHLVYPVPSASIQPVT